jgi:hypothetical protein
VLNKLDIPIPMMFDSTTGNTTSPQISSPPSPPKRRIWHFPAIYKDLLPSSTTPLTHILNYKTKKQQASEAATTRASTKPPQTSPVDQASPEPALSIEFESGPNDLGLFQQYLTLWITSIFP